jgi:hypothetical protein
MKQSDFFNNNRVDISFFILVSTLLFFITTQISAQINKVDQANRDSIYTHIKYLSSDVLQGRGTGTAGEQQAAMYISQKLKSYHVPPAQSSNSYFQNIPMHGSKALKSSKLQIAYGKISLQLRMNHDYLLYKTGVNSYIPNFVSLVFVGYGIIAPEYDYNDYQTVDVLDKIVVFLSGEPFSKDPNYFEAEKPTIYSSPEAKQRLAISRGALGSIMIPNPRADRVQSWDDLQKEFSFEDVGLAYSVNAHLSILMNPDIADTLFIDAPISLAGVYNLDKLAIMESFELETRLAFTGEFIERDFLSANVAGLISGKENKYILVTAHFDHLGIGPPVADDSIYNGLSDNAAGVAALLEISRIIAMADEKLQRSVIVLFTTGEEKGLLGSTYYCDHPIVPLYRTSANVNIDGLAIFDEFKDVVGVGGELSTLGENLSQVAQKMGLNLSEIPKEYFIESQSLSRSDQFAYARAGVPSILIVEGLNYKNSSYINGIERMIHWNQEIYHTPFDDLTQNINMDAAVQHTEILLKYIIHLANLKSDPKWKPGVPFNIARLRTIAEKR